MLTILLAVIVVLLVMPYVYRIIKALNSYDEIRKAQQGINAKIKSIEKSIEDIILLQGTQKLERDKIAPKPNPPKPPKPTKPHKTPKPIKKKVLVDEKKDWFEPLKGYKKGIRVNKSRKFRKPTNKEVWKYMGLSEREAEEIAHTKEYQTDFAKWYKKMYYQRYYKYVTKRKKGAIKRNNNLKK
tara:strand:+ start:5692 stop:6243 length:552 start_codon:yes stop_codon:yes gene_type:complete